jgi:AcrR family transcriptional regulator
LENLVSNFRCKPGKRGAEMVLPESVDSLLPPVAAAPADVAEPPWRQRAIDRSTQSVRLRAGRRVQRFLSSAREIIAEKQSIELTVQEVVDHSQQSLRSFYQYFEGKHGLLLALFEEETDIAVRRFRESAVADDPLHRLRDAVLMLYELASPGRISVQPLFAEFVQGLVADHPDEVSAAFLPLVELFQSIVQDAAAAGVLRPGRPRRIVSIILQSATMTAVRSAGGHQPITGAEVWDFVEHAIVPDEVLANRATASASPKRRVSR